MEQRQPSREGEGEGEDEGEGEGEGEDYRAEGEYLCPVSQALITRRLQNIYSLH